MPVGREGGGKAGKRQPQPLRPLPDGHLSLGRGAGGRRRGAAAHRIDRPGSPAATAPFAPSLRPALGLPPRLRPPASRRAGRGGGPGRRAVRGSARPCLRGRRRRAERPCAQRGALSATMRRLLLPCLLLLPPLLLLPAEVRPSCGRRGAAAPAPAAAAAGRRWPAGQVCGRARALSRGGSAGPARGGKGWGRWGAAVWPGGGVAHLGRDLRGLPLPPARPQRGLCRGLTAWLLSGHEAARVVLLGRCCLGYSWDGSRLPSVVACPPSVAAG